ncbi:MAG: hypothetical protein IJV65_10500 [Kiritimatiellae bacterium]|nr:hypothetical protein [Kiritimatiellia bacterium]
MKKLVILLSLCALAPRAAAQCAAQSIALKPGWNAVYVEVSPEAGPDEVFAQWPVDSVGVYDPAAFLATRQFSADGGTEGLVSSPILMWNRDYREASSVDRIPAGVVCLCFNTNLAGGTFRATLVGVPAAPRTTWHASDGGDVLNYFGFSLQPGASVTPEAYLAGFDARTGDTMLRIGGKTRGEPPSRLPFYAGGTVSDGEALLVGASDLSDWSGALFVSPQTGLDFGSSGTRATLSVRNDGGAPRTVALELGRAVRELDPRLPFSSAFLRWRDEDVARTNAAWRTADGLGEVARKRLDAGETWRVAFGLDRTKLAGAGGAALPLGVPFGALLTALDLDGGTAMKSVVPLRGETAGTDAARTAWPAGLWVAEAELDHVVAPGSTAATETGGSAKIRLPIHIDEHGAIRLLQRVVAAGETASDGTFAYRLYAGAAQVPTTASETLRVSSVVLPTETPVVAAEDGGNISEGVSFAFTVAADGATSLLRHPLHPQHDGLRWDFATPAPSGDDFANYRGDVKPETFSVSCRIDLKLDMDGGEAAWNPEGTKSGTCTWTFSNLMRQGDVKLSGAMTVKRISPLAELVLE